jgi:hypothetical protein
MRTSLPKLSRNLRRVVFARPASTAGRASAGTGVEEVVLSVHGRNGAQLGYAALRLRGTGSLWGGLTCSSELSLTDTRVLAWRTELQLSAAGLEHGGHHCLLSTPSARGAGDRAALAVEFAEALRPVCDEGPCEIVFTEDGSVEPQFVAAATGACTATATLVALERAGLEPGRSTVAVCRPGWAGREVVRGLVSHGLTLVSPPEATLSTQADVLVLDGGPRALEMADAHAVRAKLIVALAPVIPTAAAARRLRDRRVSMLSDTVTGAGRFLAVDLRRRGLEPQVAVDRAATLVLDRFDRLVDPQAAWGLAARITAARAEPG